MKKSLCLGLAIATAVVVASLFVPVCSLAAAEPTPQSCPVTIQKAEGSVHFTNQAQQPVSAVIFHAVRLNALGEEVKPDANGDLASIVANSSEQTFTSKKGLQTGEQGKVSNHMDVYGDVNEGDKLMFYVRAVKFADGTTWKDDGSHSCQWVNGR